MLHRRLRGSLALLVGGDTNFPGLTPGTSGNVDELRPLCKNETGSRDQRAFSDILECALGQAKPSQRVILFSRKSQCLLLLLPPSDFRCSGPEES